MAKYKQTYDILVSLYLAFKPDGIWTYAGHTCEMLWFGYMRTLGSLGHVLDPSGTPI